MATALHADLASEELVAWRPQSGPQTALVACPVEDVFYGGARGGGKTDGILGDWIGHAGRYGRYARGIIFRRSYGELEEVERRCLELFPLLGASYNKASHTWTFPNGATLRMRHLDRDADASKYQGHQYTWMAFDELGNWPSPDPIDLLWACLRSPHGVPCVRRSSGNPGGPGHNWIKARYIDPAAPFGPFTYRPQPERSPDLAIHAVFIPATLEDNPLLMEKDPGYERRLAASAHGNLYLAWRYGRWDIVAGGFFDDLWDRDYHVVPPFRVPSSWYVDRAFDWGSAKPFSVGWYAESDGTKLPDGRVWPRGTLFRVGEWYGMGQKVNEGCRMLAVDVAKGIRKYEKSWGRYAIPGPADSSIFDVENGVSIEQDMRKWGVKWRRANKNPGSRANGWERCRQYLAESLKGKPQGEGGGTMESAGFYVFANCVHFIRTVPVLPRDDKKPDDIDTDAEDHVADEWRYRILDARPSGTVGSVVR